MSFIGSIFRGNINTKVASPKKQEAAPPRPSLLTKAPTVFNTTSLAPSNPRTGPVLYSGTSLSAVSSKIAPPPSGNFFSKIGSFFEKAFNGIKNFLSPQKPASVVVIAKPVPSTNIFTPPNKPVITPAILPAVETETPDVSDKFANMFNSLGITAKTAATIAPSEFVKNGDVIEYSYHDKDTNSDVKLKINQELTTKDTLVFDEYNTNLQTGTCGHIIHTITQTADGFIDKKATLQRWKPPAPEPAPTFPSISTYHSVIDTVGVKEYKILTNGTESIQTTTIPSSETTLTVLGPDGGVLTTLTNVSVTKLKNIDTGLHDVRM